MGLDFQVSQALLKSVLQRVGPFARFARIEPRIRSARLLLCTELFGPVILAMLFINFFANLILLWAAWIATSNQPAVARRHSLGDEILRGQELTVTVEDHWAHADAEVEQRLQADRSASQLGTTQSPADGRRPARLRLRIRRGAGPAGRRIHKR